MIAVLFFLAALFVFGGLVAKALAGFPFLGMVPFMGDMLVWAGESAGILIAVGITMFVFTTTRSIIWSIASLIAGLAVMMYIGWWSI